MIFDEHGTYVLWAEQNLICTKFEGAINSETVKAYIDEMDEIIEHLSHQDYFVLLDLLDVEGATPDAWETAKQHNQLLAQDNSLKAKAIISNAFLVHEYAKQMNQPIASEKVSSFNDLDAAVVWLKRQGAKHARGLPPNQSR